MYTSCCIQTPVQFSTAKLREATAADTNRANILIRSLSVAVAVPGVKTSARAYPDGDGLGLGLGVCGGVNNIMNTVFNMILSSPVAKYPNNTSKSCSS